MLAYVQGELIVAEMNVFDAALALIALGHLGADVASFTPALNCIVGHLGEGGRHGPYRAYEWNKMKTPTRILVGGSEVTSAFVLMGLALARRAMTGRGYQPPAVILRESGVSSTPWLLGSITDVSGILGHPLSRVMTTGNGVTLCQPISLN